jgi:hypothetical protein
MRDAVVQLKLTDWEIATEAYAQELGRPYVDLAQMVPDDSVLDKIPRSTVKRNAILPLFIDDEVLLVARFAPVAAALKANESDIVDELNAVQGQAMDIGGYYHPNRELAARAMRPSATLNAIIDGI